MSVYVIGVNHKTAPISVREKVYFAEDKLGLYLQDLLSHQYANEAVLLSTCNRSELYCETEDFSQVKDWFCEQADLSRSELEPVLYFYREAEAIQHMMEVACGLDSMVLGEPQILGQLKEAFSEGCTAGAVGPLFHRLFQQVFSLAKEIRTTTMIGACPVSVASAAAHFAKQQSEDFLNAKVMLIGAGDTVEILVRYLQPQLRHPIALVNRSIEKAKALAEQTGGFIYGLGDIHEALTQADLVFTATGSAVPLIHKGMMETVMQARQQKPMTLIDVAVPRDVDALVATVPNVNLYCIDDLKMIIEQNRRGREHAADKAFELIKNRSTQCQQDLQSFDKVAHTIRAYRGQIEAMCRSELMKAKQQLFQGMNPEEVMDQFARAFIQKLMHAPSVQLRQAGAAGRFDLLRLAKQLFSLPDPEAELL